MYRKHRKPLLFLMIAALCLIPLFAACSARTAADSYASAPEAGYNSASKYTMDESVEMESTDFDAGYDMVPEPGMGMVEAPTASKEGFTGGTLPNDENTVRKLIYTLDLTLIADEPAAALQALTDTAVQAGGYVSSSYAENDDKGVYWVRLTMRIPPEALDALRSHAQTLGKVTSDNLYTDEITEEYWDIQARLTSALAQEEQLLALLKECQNVEETLQVRDALATVQQEIEVYKGHIRLWDSQVAYSTVNVTISRTPATPVENDNELIPIWAAGEVWQTMRNAVVNTGRFLVNAGYGILIFLAYALIPLALLAAIIVPIVLVCRYKHKKKKVQEPEQE